MKTGTRLYINITNRCNTTCPFCCMYSGESKSTEMPFETYKQIIDENDGEFELQLEGGEPLLNRNIYLFIEYAIRAGYAPQRGYPSFVHKGLSDPGKACSGRGRRCV